jgi:hypothetical protein
MKRPVGLEVHKYISSGNMLESYKLVCKDFLYTMKSVNTSKKFNTEFIFENSDVLKILLECSFRGSLNFFKFKSVARILF